MQRSGLINFLIIGGIVLVLVIIQSLLYTNPAETSESEDNANRSTYSSTTFGLRGLYLFLEESGYNVSRYRSPFTDLESKGLKSLIVVSPLDYAQPTEEEFKALTSWVEKGGQLVVVDREINLKFGSDVTIRTRRFFSDTIPVKIEQPSDLTHDVRDIHFSESRSFINITGGSYVYYVGESHGAILAGLSYGKGRIIFLSEPYIMANNGISQDDNQTLALNIIRNVAPDKNVAFDEYHHGYGAKMQSGMVGYFSGTPIMWMFGQLVLLTLIVVYTNGRRFARPIPVKEEDRASSLEFVGSMAHLQGLAAASDLAIENIYGRFRKRLCRYAGQPTNVNSRQLAEAVARRGNINPAVLHKVLVRCEEVLSGGNLKEEELLSITTRIRQWQTELGL